MNSKKIISPQYDTMSFWQCRPKHVIEYAALRYAGALVRVLPYRVALAIAWFIAFFAHYVLRWRAAEAHRRIREVFGSSKSNREVHRIAWLAMRNLVFSAVDSGRLPDLTLKWIHLHVDYGEFEKVKSLANGRGAVLVMPHVGSWDLAAVGMQKCGLPVFTIVARQKNPLTDGFINQLRGISGEIGRASCRERV